MLSKLLLLGSLVAFSSSCWASSSAVAPSGWQTYNSPKYGFAISYPASMKFYAQYGRGADPGGYAPVCFDTTVACFGYIGNKYPGTNFEGAGLAINVLRDAKSEQECNTLGSLKYPRPTTKAETIHGMLFHVGEIGEGGMSHFQGMTAYRTFYQNVCFELAAQIDTVSVGVFEPGTIKQFDSTKLKKLFDEMVHTFQFVGPVKDGSNWKVSRDSGCGVFEYPADATLRVIAQNLFDRPGSDRITCSLAFTHQGHEYTLAVKMNGGDQTTVDVWLKSSGYPVLSDARVVNKSAFCTEYDAGPYHYIYRQGEVIIFSVSDVAGHVISLGDDPVYKHWLASFRL